jgi:hypothetical protein
MDETGVRTMLSALAGTEAPQARFDLDGAVSRGRRGRRLRRARAGGSAFAIGTVIGAVVAVLVVPSPGPGKAPALTPRTSSSAHASVQPTTRPSVSRPSARPTGRATTATKHVPEQFSPLSPYASFGWLPEGLTTVGQAASTSTDSTALTAAGKPGTFWLHVMSKGACGHIRTLLNCHWDSGDVSGPLPQNDRAPDVNGRPAYWTYGDSILWEYAPGAWATLLGPGGYNSAPSPSLKTLTLEVADGVRYGYQTPQVFPFWVSGLPASWQPSTSVFIDSQPPMQATGLDFGPVEKPQAVQLNVTPASQQNSCQFAKGDSYVTLDGVQAVVQGSSYAQQLCISNLNGQSIGLLLSLRFDSNGAPVPGAASIGGVAALFKHLHLLGSQVSTWTTEPFR